MKLVLTAEVSSDSAPIAKTITQRGSSAANI
jgi:hypothetical protein